MWKQAASAGGVSSMANESMVMANVNLAMAQYLSAQYNNQWMKESVNGCLMKYNNRKQCQMK
jgi:hypothetical protein